MGVEHQALDARQPIGSVVGEFAARLQEARARVGEEMRHRDPQPFARRPEVDIEHGDDRRIALGEPGGQRASLEAAAILAAHMLNVEALRAQLLRRRRREHGRIVSAVVEKLNVELFLRPIERRGGAQSIGGQFALVEGGDLHQHMRQHRIAQFHRRDGRAPTRPGDELDDIDGDEKQEAAADENEAENGERQKDLKKDAHNFEDDQRRIPFGCFYSRSIIIRAYASARCLLDGSA